MVGLVIVSHSQKIAEGVKDLAMQMAPDYQGMIAAGGLEDGEIGTDPMKIMDAIRQADSGDGVVVLADLGSGIMSAETAIEFLEDEGIMVKIADAPIVEGAIVAAVEADGGSDFDTVLRVTESTRGESKLS